MYDLFYFLPSPNTWSRYNFGWQAKLYIPTASWELLDILNHSSSLTLVLIFIGPIVWSRGFTLLRCIQQILSSVCYIYISISGSKSVNRITYVLYSNLYTLFQYICLILFCPFEVICCLISFLRSAFSIPSLYINRLALCLYRSVLILISPIWQGTCSQLVLSFLHIVL